jgi:phosphohistidine phosphatase
LDLYIIRHAIAGERDPMKWPDDGQRPLTAEGRRRFKEAARGMGRLVPGVELHLSSPLVRAWQTAEILESEAGWPAPVACEALAGGQGVEASVAVLIENQRRASIAFVSHEPHVSELVSYLLTGAARHAHVEFKKGAAACVSLPEGPVPGTAALKWLLPPKVLRGLG